MGEERQRDGLRRAASLPATVCGARREGLGEGETLGGGRRRWRWSPASGRGGGDVWVAEGVRVADGVVGPV